MTRLALAAVTLTAAASAAVWLTRPAAGAAPGTSVRCAGDEHWFAEKGTLVRGSRCGEWIGATDAAHYAYANGIYRWKRAVSAPYDVHVTWQRLGGEGRTLEVFLPNSSVMLGDDKVSLWVGDQEWTGWEPRPGLRIREEHDVRVEVRATEVRLFVDDELTATWPYRGAGASGEVALAHKAPAKVRAKMRFRDFRVVEGGN